MAEPSACPEHQSLVAQAMAPDAPDHILERYAETVPQCEACQRELARDLQVHPVVLQSREPGPASLDGMEELLTAMQRQPSRVRWPGVVLAAGGLAAAAAFLWVTTPPQPSVTPAPVPTAPRMVDVAPSEPAPRAPLVEQAPEVPVVPPRPLVRPKPSPRVVAVAPAPSQDWPPPSFVELRNGTPKAATPVRSAQLVLGGSGPERHVGDVVQLTVVNSSPTEVSVCVSGPEHGVVWRGGVPAGRVPLTQAARDVSFAFSAPGTYRFSLTPDASSCTDPVHVVEVEVRG